MKLYIFKFVLVFCLPLLALSKNPEAEPGYKIGKSSLDPSLKKNESAFQLVFYGTNGFAKNIPVTFSYNGVEKKIDTGPTSAYKLIVKPGKYKFQFYNERFSEIYTDSIKIKPGYKTILQVLFKLNETMTEPAKPVIYIYSPDTISVKMMLKPNIGFSFTYPEYKNGWNFKATPGGDLLMNNATYPYLFWDGKIMQETSDLNGKEGYIVSSENTISFFEEKLKIMGFNSKESTDFITYWCPLMNINQQNYVRFLFNEEFEKYAPLTVDPKPETKFRVFMIWSPVKDKAEIIKPTEQKIPTFIRKGLTVVEWGGTEISLTHP